MDYTTTITPAVLEELDKNAVAKWVTHELDTCAGEQARWHEHRASVVLADGDVLCIAMILDRKNHTIIVGEDKEIPSLPN